MHRRKKPVRAAKWLRPALIAAGLFAVLFVLFITVVTPERHDIKPGYPAPVTVFATKDVEDAVTTQKLRDSAAAAADLTYRSVDSTVLSGVLNDFSAACTVVSDLREQYAQTDPDSFTDEDVAKISEESGLTLSRSDLVAVLGASQESLDAALASARTMVRDTLNSTLPEGQESSAISKISRDLLAEGYEPAAVTSALAVTRATLRPNMLIDEETTELNRQKARDLVEVQMCVKGEAVVREGDIVTEAEYQILSDLGLITDSDFDLMLILGLAAVTLLLLGALALYLYLFETELLECPRKLLLLALIIAIVAVLNAAAGAINVYLMPVSLGLMLIAVLLNGKLAIFVNVILGLTVSLMATPSTGGLSTASFAMLLMAISAGPIVVLIVSKHIQRTAVLVAGLLVGASNFVVTMAIGLISSASLSSVLVNAAWAAGGGLLAAVICIGIQPLMEWLFNLVTNAKLLELSNPNQPLLHKLLLEAPGTYHHSIIVANLADAAATAIGANALLARVAAYYHDVGKLKRPMYFKENQLGDNPHDRTDPRVSTAILTAHTRDGVAMAKREHLPQEIIDVIQQHHGDSPVLYFYDKAKKLYGEDVDVSTFRYEGPRPCRREAAVVMLADIIEAATRSMASHDPQKIEQLIRKLVRDKLTDGQLDGADLTFKDLDVICDAFITVLSGVFHERIEYPDVKLPPRERQSAEDAPQEEAHGD